MEDNVLWGNALKQGLKFANIPEYLIRFRVDKHFYERRSGIKYGLSYLKIRFETIKMLNAPLYIYITFLLLGLLRMFPSNVVRLFYKFIR